MPQRNGLIVMLRLVGLVRPLIFYMVLAVTLGVAGHLCAVGITIAGGYGLLAVFAEGAEAPLHFIAALMVVMAILRGLLRYGEQLCNHFLAFKLLALIRDRVFRALRRLCPAKLEGRDRGDLIAVITSDIELLEVFYAHTISPIAIAALFCGAMSVYIGSFYWLLGLLAVCAYGIVGVGIPLVASRISAGEGTRLRVQSGALSSFVLESLRGLSELLQYGQGDARLAEMQRRTAALSEVEAEQKLHAGTNQAVTNTVIMLSDLAMLGVSAWLYLQGALTCDGVLLATLAMFSSFGPCVALANLGSTLQNTFAAGNRVLDILEEEPVVEEISGCAPVYFDGAEVRNLSFSYGDEEILTNVSCCIPEGQIVGIVGKSGSGKSTLLKLLMRFWQAPPESIRISDRDIASINTDNLRAMESYVTQETHLFHDSIAANLRIAKADATDEELVAACRKAAVHDFIMTLPQGYDTRVGELGDTLSGGERQRLGLARAFLHDAPLMLLDEPTSNLDSLNEAVILRALAEERTCRAVVLVSHRASTMRIADTVYSVESGRLS